MGALACCRRWVVALGVFATSGLKTLTCPRGRQVWNEDADVVFGQTADFSGEHKDFGDAVRMGILVAFHDLNTRSARARVGLVSYDDAGSPRCSKSNTQGLITGDRVLALLGSVGNDTADAMRQAARQHEVGLLGPVSGTVELRQEPFVINIRTSYQDEVKMMVHHFVEERYMRSFAVVLESDSSIHHIIRDELESHRLVPTCVVTYANGTASVEDYAAQRGAAGPSGVGSSPEPPEVVFLSGSYKWGARTIMWARQQWPQAEYAVLAMLGIEKLGPELLRLVEEGGDTDFPFDAVHITSAVPSPRNVNSFAIRRYQDAVRAYTSEFLNHTDPVYDPLVLEGYLIGRLVLDVLDTALLWDKAGVIGALQNATEEELRYARREYVTAVYRGGLFNFAGFSMGPYMLQCDLDIHSITVVEHGNGTDRLHLEPDRCFCTQGMNKVFGNRLDQRGDLVRYEVADYTGTSCGAQTRPSYSAFGFRGGADMYAGMNSVISPGRFLGMNSPKIVTCDGNDDLEFAGLFGNIGCDTAEDIAACTAKQIMPSILHIGVKSGALSLRVPYRREIVNVRVSDMDETVALAYFITRNHTRVSILYENTTEGLAGLDGAVAALATMGVRVWTRGMYSVENSTDCGAAADIDNTSIIAALDNITGANVAGPPEAVFLLGNCTRYLAAFIELARARPRMGAVTYTTRSMNSGSLARELKTSENRDNILVTQVVPLPDDTSSRLVQEYQRDMGSGDLSFDSLEGYIVGRLVLAVFTALPMDFTINQFLDLIYARGGGVHDIAGVKLGPYNERCNQGMRTVYFTRMQGDGTFRYDEGMRSEAFDTPGTVACGNWTDLGCASGFHRPHGSEVCVRCEKGFYLECDAACEARQRPSSKFEKFNTTCMPCPKGRYGPQEGLRSSEQCLTCGFGTHTDSAGQTACSTCPRGHHMVNGSMCVACEAGTQPGPDSEGLSEDGIACVPCEAGTMSTQGGMCTDCPAGRYSSRPGRSECAKCPYGTRSPAGVAACTFSTDIIYFDVQGLILLMVAVVLGSRIVRISVPILDVIAEDRSVMIQTLGPHCICNYFGLKPEIRFHSTGNGRLDFPPEPYRVNAISAERLELLSRGGDKVTSNSLFTSTGFIECRFPWTVLTLGRSHVSFGACLVICVVAGVAMHAAARTRAYEMPSALHYLAMVAAVLILYLIVESGLWLHQGATPIHKSILAFQKILLESNPAPKKTTPGPGRAVRVEQLTKFFAHFQNWIGNRDMYYVASNLLLPLTKKYQLSYAEVAGPTKVSWFVSHYWGTPFTHFVDCIRLHHQNVEGHVVDMRFGDDTAQEPTDAYWICSLSNNQWCLHEELSSRVEDSSFYKTLRSGCCLGTAMILDSDALPLTRCWCLFEVLQTVMNFQEDKNFSLMLCTATGVLNFGVSRVDVAMAIAKKLTSLRLEDATASFQSDKEMIDQAIEHLGRSQVNLFLRSIFREALKQIKAAFDYDFHELASELDREQEDAQELQNLAGPPQNELLRKETVMLEAAAVPSPSNRGDIALIRRRTTKLA